MVVRYQIRKGAIPLYDGVQFLNESHFARGELPLRAILKRMRHEGCGGQPAKAELLSGAEAASSRSVRRIVLLSD